MLQHESKFENEKFIEHVHVNRAFPEEVLRRAPESLPKLPLVCYLNSPLEQSFRQEMACHKTDLKMDRRP